MSRGLKMKINGLDDLLKIKARGLRSLYPQKRKVTVGMASCGLASGAGEVYGALQDYIKDNRMDIILSKTGCIGFCQREPIISILETGSPNIFYPEISPDSAIERLNGDIDPESALFRIDQDGAEISDIVKQIPHYYDIAFYKDQMRNITRNCGIIDPESIEEYIALDGYAALAKVLEAMTPEKVIDQIKRSGLRGRGGAGFPTGRKWASCRAAVGEKKYVICNADEGDPGAYMDRNLLESDPHAIIEGMIIGAYAIGSHDGYIYIRNEYPLAIKHLEIALEQARSYGLLGKDIMGSGFAFDIKISRGAGAFVCGESTALMASLEGKLGEPRAKYIHTVESGLYGMPSNLNNVETWANVPRIIDQGVAWYQRIGTNKSRGTKIFSLVGKVNNTGLVEVPMGMTLREIIYGIGGGIPDGKDFKAVQTGGPSGGCIPEELIDLPVDYEALTDAGSMMGSGGMIIMDETTCMVEIARYFISFLKEESCGKCVPCREGLRQMNEILERITMGNGVEGDLECLEELSELLKDASLCGLGQTAPNPVLTTIRYFRDEYEAHIRDKKCPAGVCKALIRYLIDEERCNGCGRCLKRCPQNAISGEKGEVYVIDQDLCIKCGICRDVCTFDAVVIK